MDDSLKKKLKIIFSVVGLALAIGILLMTSTKKNMADQDKKVILMCLDCQKTFEISNEKLDKLIEANNSEDGQNVLMPDMTDMTFKCKHCGEEKAKIALKCKKCGSIFVVDYGITIDYPDRCPDCGYSHMESIRAGK